MSRLIVLKTKLATIWETYQNVIMQGMLLIFVAGSQVYTSNRLSLFSNLCMVHGLWSAIQYIKILNTFAEENNFELLTRIEQNEQHLEQDWPTQKALEYIISKSGASSTTPTSLLAATSSIPAPSVATGAKQQFGILQKRLLLFGTLQCLSGVYSLFTWNLGTIWFDLVLLLTFGLPCLHLAFSLVIESLYFNFMTQLRQGILYIVSKMMAQMINSLIETFTPQHDPVTYLELLNMYQHDTLYPMSFSFLKTVMMQSATQYVKRGGGEYSYFVDAFCRYQTLSLQTLTKSSHEIIEYNIKALTNIIHERKWKKFLNPQTVNILFEVYEAKRNYRYIMRLIVMFKNIELNLARFFTFWSLCSVHVSVALAVDVYFSFYIKRYTWSRDVKPYVIAALICVMFHPLLGAVLIVTSDWIIKPVLDYCNEVGMFDRLDLECWIRLPLVLVIWQCQLLTIPLGLFAYYILADFLTLFIMVSVSLAAQFSGFALVHILFLWFTETLVYCVYIRKSEVKPVIKSDLQENYLKKTQSVALKSPSPHVPSMPFAQPLPNEEPKRDACSNFFKHFSWSS